MRSAARTLLTTYLTFVLAGTLMAATVALIFAGERVHVLVGLAACLVALVSWRLRHLRR